MERRWLKHLAMAAMAVGLGAACSDRPGSITALPPQPRLAYLNGYVALTGTDGKQWIVLTGVGKDIETKSAVIDRDGGDIKLSGTTVSVPRNAVGGPTLFTVTVLTQPYIKVQLSAVTVSGSGRGNKGGQELHDFSKTPITLTMSILRGAKKNLPDPSLFKMLYVVNDQVEEVLQTTVAYTRDGVVAKLYHFSDYTPGVPADVNMW